MHRITGPHKSPAQVAVEIENILDSEDAEDYKVISQTMAGRKAGCSGLHKSGDCRPSRDSQNHLKDPPH